MEDYMPGVAVVVVVVKEKVAAVMTSVVGPHQMVVFMT